MSAPAAAGLERDAARLDKWLWSVRFFKTRSQATAAVSGGRVHLNGARVKPAHAVRPGDRIEASLGTRAIEVVVRALPSRRGPATEARACYEETPESVARAARAAEQHRVAGMAGPVTSGRPDKRDRRRLAEFTRRQAES